MISNFWALIQVIKALFGLWSDFKEWQRVQKAKEDAARHDELVKGVDEAKKAETEDDIWKSQEDITNNLPKP